jgi:hypothetical protein
MLGAYSVLLNNYLCYKKLHLGKYSAGIEK